MGDLLITIQHADVIDKERRDRLTFRRAKESCIHRMLDDGAHVDDVTARDRRWEQHARVAGRHQPQPFSVTNTFLAETYNSPVFISAIARTYDVRRILMRVSIDGTPQNPAT